MLPAPVITRNPNSVRGICSIIMIIIIIIIIIIAINEFVRRLYLTESFTGARYTVSYQEVIYNFLRTVQCSPPFI